MNKRITALLWAFALAVFMTACNSAGTKEVNDSKTVSNETAVTEKSTSPEKSASEEDLKPEMLTAALFKEKVWDYENNPGAWVYKGEIPCVVDFYADWCKPCKIVAPIMDDLADYYNGRVKIYKVNTDEQRELASVFQVRSIPSILFAPATGQPAMQPGALSREQYIEIIDEFVLGLKKEESNK
ncbi:MAG: thioredoxin [Bacteroidales bacterium]|nr:thioredoxin [Bacteroidales bacterium]